MARGINVYTGYGMSDCPVLTISALNATDEFSLDPRLKTGNPIPMVDLMTVGQGMTKMPRDGVSVGEIVVRAPWLNAEYIGILKQAMRCGKAAICTQGMSDTLMNLEHL